MRNSFTIKDLISPKTRIQDTETLSMKKIKIIPVLMIVPIVCACNPVEDDDTKTSGNVTVTSIQQLNNGYEDLDSHKGYELQSLLEPIAGYQLSLGKDILGIDNPVYARIKKCADGSFLLMYQNGQIAPLLVEMIYAGSPRRML